MFWIEKKPEVSEVLALLGFCCVSHGMPFNEVGKQVSMKPPWERCKTWLENRQETSMICCQMEGWME